MTEARPMTQTTSRQSTLHRSLLLLCSHMPPSTTLNHFSYIYPWNVSFRTRTLLPSVTHSLCLMTSFITYVYVTLAKMSFFPQSSQTSHNLVFLFASSCCSKHLLPKMLIAHNHDRQIHLSSEAAFLCPPFTSFSCHSHYHVCFPILFAPPWSCCPCDATYCTEPEKTLSA